MYIKGVGLVKRNTGFATVAGLQLGRWVEAVDGFCHDARAGSFAHAARAGKQKRLCQGVAADGIFQGGGYRLLANHHIKSDRPVFACGDNEIFHEGNEFCLKST